MSGDVGCWCALFGTLVGVSVLSVMWLELESVSEISSPRWSSVYECQSVECGSLKDQSCHLPCSTITLLICQGRLHRSRGFATLTTSQSGLLDQIFHS